MTKLRVFLLCLFISYANGSWLVHDDDPVPKWIGAPKSVQLEALKGLDTLDKDVIKAHPGLKPALYFRKTFSFEKPVVAAELYISAKGVFQGYVSISNYSLFDGYGLLSPGWTDYNKTIQYYMFPVEDILNEHMNNTIGIIVGSGWYSGYIGEKYNVYGNDQSTLVQLRIVFGNGSEALLVSDETWKVTTGPLVYSDLIHGELYYENRELGDWISYDYDDSKWLNVITSQVDRNVVIVSDNLPVSIFPKSYPDNYWKVGNKTWVYDFSSVMNGRIIITPKGFPYTARVQVRYAESIYPNGSIYTGNHKTALITDTFILNDPTNRPFSGVYTPLFTYHSFRYVEVSGFPMVLNPTSEIQSIGLSQVFISSRLHTSNTFITSLTYMIENSVINNILSIQTNNPSGDARLGWLEPAGLYSETAMYALEASANYRKWLSDVRDCQASSGAFSNTSPTINEVGDASPGSGFAPILITYNLLKYNGDVVIAEENYAANKKWIDYVVGSNPNFLFTNNVKQNDGDFANVNAETPKEIISTAYFAYGAYLMSYMARALHRNVDSEYFNDLHKNVSNAFVKAYVNATDGKIIGDTQTGYVVGLAFKIFPNNLINKAVQNLVNNIKDHDYHLTTGYVGTAFLLPVLVDHGHADIAFKLLNQQTFPSWGYMINNNASSIWERWDSWTAEKGFSGSSFDSLALGSVGSFLYRYLAGIDTDSDEIGFKKVIIKPYIAEGVTDIFGMKFSKYGQILSQWKIVDNVFNISVRIPDECTGKLIIPFVNPIWERELTSGEHNFSINLSNFVS